jgi:glycosyltransferase involved in cell wall biosynthesis
MKKVYIVTSESFPVGFAATNRIKCYAKALIREGFCIEVLIYKRGIITKDFPPSGIVDGIKYQYVGGNVARPNNKILARIFDIYDRLMLLAVLWRKLKRHNFVLGYITRPFASFILVLSHMKRCFYIAELCEYPYQDSTKPEWKKRIGTWILLRHQFPRYDGVIAISQTLVDFAEKHVSKKCTIIKVPILVDMGRFDNYDLNSARVLEDYTLVHAGSLTEKKDGILGVIKAFAISSQRIDKPMKFLCTGNVNSSPHQQEIMHLIGQYQLKDKLKFTGYLKEEELKSLLNKASFFIINKYPTMQNKYCFATKLGEYLAMGKVVIATKCGEVVNWLHHKEDAYFVEPYDIEGLANAIVEIITDNKLRTKIEKNARKRCEESFAYENYSHILSELLITLSHK